MHNNNGRIGSSSFKCSYCKYNTYPVNLTGGFVCTAKSNMNAEDLTDNCVKYDINQDTNKYECTYCKSGYFL